MSRNCSAEGILAGTMSDAESSWGGDAVTDAFVALYGDPCAECGYSFSRSLEDAMLLIGAIPGRYEDLVSGARGDERHPDLSWSVGAYVCHVADNFSIWAERLAGVALGPNPEVAPYDENRLADARVYEGIALAGALFSLERSVADFALAMSLARKSGAVMRHPERGTLSLAIVARGVAHDAFHHAWDIERSLAESA